MRHQCYMDASAAASQTLYSFDRLLIIRVGTEVEIEMAVANRGQVVLHHVHDHLRFLPARHKNCKTPLWVVSLE